MSTYQPLSGFSLQGAGNNASSFLAGTATNQDQKVKNNGAAMPVVQATSTGMSLAGGAPGQALNQSATGTRQLANIKRVSSVTPTDVATDAATAAAKAKAAQDAADAAHAGALRGEVTNLVNSIKNLLNQRYGQLDAAAQEQTGKLNTRFQNESADLTGQITGETNTAGGAFAGRGTRDSSDYGNTVDDITNKGQAQIRDLGTELEDNTAAVGNYVQKEKASLDGQKGGYDATVAHLQEEKDPGRLTDLRNQIDAKLREVQAGQQDNATQKDSLSALNTIAPTNARAQSLQTTLSKIVGSNAPTGQKSAIAQQLIKASGVSGDEAQRLAQAFQSDLSTTDKQQQVQQ